jgi:hypothetical protein
MIDTNLQLTDAPEEGHQYGAALRTFILIDVDIPSPEKNNSKTLHDRTQISEVPPPSFRYSNPWRERNLQWRRWAEGKTWRLLVATWEP